MSSVSGLSAPHRAHARNLAAHAALLGLRHAPAIHYTQQSARWDGIRLHLKAYRGEYPRNADCSAYVTWCLWNGLDHYGVRDVVNAADWLGGYTGTMLDHGKPVAHLENVLRGDAVLYGHSKTGDHTAIIVGVRAGIPMVVSHGSEGGPYYLPYNYRPDIISLRRYI